MMQLSSRFSETDMKDSSEVPVFSESMPLEHKNGNGWPDGYFERVIGSLSDPTYVVDDAGLDPSLDDEYRPRD